MTRKRAASGNRVDWFVDSTVVVVFAMRPLYWVLHQVEHFQFQNSIFFGELLIKSTRSFII